eukprot:COSAG01_NODE_43867_length_425_cov_0.941718_1_plen_21_part_10
MEEAGERNPERGLLPSRLPPP